MYRQSIDDGDQANILVVDDTHANLRLLVDILSDAGYKVRPAPNGTVALAAVQAVKPDLILLDVRMPGLDGYEVCERLKADETTCDIPVIFISAANEVFNKVQAFAKGAVDYITKPFQMEEVLARVKTHLILHHMRTRLAAQNLQLEEEILQRQRLLEEREHLIQELDAYAHTVAHDLKNPLSIIIGYAEVLAKDLDHMPVENVQRSVRSIAQSARKMAVIIDELLLLASARNLQDVEPLPLNMRRIVEEALQRLAPVIKKSGAEIQLPEIWPDALGYGPWVEQVWVNYLSNGVKYGGQPEGGVPPKLFLGADRVSSLSEDGAYVRFWVRDNGPGLPEEAQPRVFEAFYRLSSHPQAEGHGLGLSIVQRIVNKLGGTVGVESRMGAGSTFYFTLPQA